MSEFTSGNLFLRQHKDKVLQALEKNVPTYKVKDLNDVWSAAFAPGFDGDLPEISQDVPILFFFNAEDHGWGYRLFREGETVAAAEVSYELSFAMAQNAWEEGYPDRDPFEEENREEFQQLFQEIEESEAYQEAYGQQFAEANVEAFRLFDLEEATMEQLGQILAPGYVAGFREQVAHFMACLGIEEMSWMSYHYLEDDEG